jgi:hypothetical protein
MLLTTNLAAGLAASRTNSESRTSRPTVPTVAQHQQFLRSLNLHAACLLLSVPNLSGEDRQFLHDIRRSEGRYGMRAIERLMLLSARSLRKAHRIQLGEMIREMSEPATSDPADLYVADMAETEMQSAFDLSVKRFRQFPTRANQEAALKDGREQIAATETVMESIAAFPVQ